MRQVQIIIIAVFTHKMFKNTSFILKGVKNCGLLAIEWSVVHSVVNSELDLFVEAAPYC